MRTVSIFMTAALVAGSLYAQESVDSILKELGGYKAAPVAVPAEEPALETPASFDEPAMEAPASFDEPVIEAPASFDEPTMEAPAAMNADVDVDALIEDSRDLYVGGEFERAQAGFKQAVTLAPENRIARMYLRKLIERDHRMTEVAAMETVTGEWNTSLVIRSYPLSSDAVEKMGLEGIETASDVAMKFPEADFPKGASAVYQPAMEKVFVRNTRENLTIIEEVLDAMDVAKLSTDVDQVEIEAKFIEISEGTLEALGFEWRSTGEFGGSIHTGIENKDVVIPNGQHLFDDALRGGPGNGQQPNIPFRRPSDLGAGSDSAGVQAGQLEDWTAFRFEDTFNRAADTVMIESAGSVPLDIIISALDQSTGADVLSAPRVVTKSGETAIIRVGQMHTYPEVYEPSASGGNIVHVKYEDWEEKLLGVELEVTPQVDGDQIELALNPKITELQGWQNYEVAPEDSAYTWYQYRIGLKFNHDRIQARLPIFRIREIETEVTIADGATMVMGGLVNERVEAYEDKVPFLGSLPLVGRLFRNEGERAVKRNLMMFVSAKKIEATGRVNTSRSFE